MGSRAGSKKYKTHPGDQELSMHDPDEYRPGIGIYLFNSSGEVLVAKRLDNTSEAWQMPQGGIDDGEDAQDALYRELMEEIGIDKSKVELVKEIEEWLYYDLPQHLTAILWNGRYKGQRQRWFALKFNGRDSDININTDIPEFSEWKWAKPDTLADMIVEFKRPLYAEVLRQLSHLKY
jgi:putative (di)nucleoside polyphosphate hydrolase